MWNFQVHTTYFFQFHESYLLNNFKAKGFITFFKLSQLITFCSALCMTLTILKATVDNSGLENKIKQIRTCKLSTM